MTHAKWNTEEIEETRLQLNLLQQQAKQYAGARKLGVAFFNALKAGVKARWAQLTTKRVAIAKQDGDFAAVNPDFTPYKIRLKTPPVGIEIPKILHVIPYFITGGSQQLIVDIIEGLSDEYVHEVALFSTSTQQGYFGVKIHDCSSVQEAVDFTSLLSQINPSILHIHYYGKWPYVFWHWYHAVFQAAFAYGCPVIENCNIPYMPYFANNISKYIYVSRYARDTYGIRSMPNEVIYPGSNLSFFQRADTQPDADTIGMVYRLDQDKLNENAIIPFILTVQKRPQTKVLIVGGGHYLELFQQKVIQAGVQSQFIFTGYVAYEKLASLYQQMAIFVAPVYSESFGQVTPFAMNMAIPVVAYDIGALEEILDNSDILAPADDAEALSDIIVNLLNDPIRRAQIGAFNQARCTQLFSVQTMVHAYKELYDSIVLKSTCKNI